MVQAWMRIVAIGIVLHLCGTGSSAQMLAGPWIEQSQQQIDEARKTDLRVIVFNANGKPAPNVEVSIEQTRSFFQVGVVLPGPDSDVDWPGKIGSDSEFWRCINSVSLERLTNWPDLQPATGDSLNYDAAQRIEQVLTVAQKYRLYVRWGALISADAGRVPPWVAELQGRTLASAAKGYASLIWERFGDRVDQYDVYTQTLTHNTLDHRSGLAVVRELYESLPVISDGAIAVAGFDDGLSIERVQLMQRQVTTLREAFVPIGTVAVNQRFGGTLDRQSLQRVFSRLDPIRYPVVISGLAVGGDSDLNAAINLETLLRTVMERPYVTGIWFTDLSPDEAIDRTSTLIDEQGELTPSGRVVDSLFHDLWQTHMKMTTDELGNARLRAFPGDYELTATLQDGTVLHTVIRLEKSDDPRVVFLEPGRK